MLSGIQQLVVRKEHSGQSQRLAGTTCQESLCSTDLWGRALSDRHLPVHLEGLTTMKCIHLAQFCSVDDLDFAFPFRPHD